MNTSRLLLALGGVLGCAALLTAADRVVVPDWALPGSATHQQVPPPAGFTRPSVHFDTPLGIFTGQSDIGGPLLPGRASFDAATGRYALTSASYNIWYFRDEFRFAWKKMSGDVSLAADITFPNPEGYFDRKTVLIIRQDLDDNAQEIMAALHGGGLIHLALRPAKGADLAEACRIEAKDNPPGPVPTRLGIEKKGDAFQLYASLRGEPMRPVGAPVTLKFNGPFYVGIGFCSHVPDQSDTTELARLVLADAAGLVK